MILYRLNLRGSYLHHYPKTKRYGWSAWAPHSGEGVPVTWVHLQEAEGFIERNRVFTTGAIIVAA
jgi:hypothetical protein